MSQREVPVPAQIPQGQGACCLCAVRITSSPSTETCSPPAGPLEPLSALRAWSLPGRGPQTCGDRAILQPPCVWRLRLPLGLAGSMVDALP